MILAALQTLIREMPTIAPLLARWEFDATHKLAAVFTEEVPPSTCGVPVVCMKLDEDKDFEAVRSTNTRYRQAEITCRVWGEPEGSERGLRKLADALGLALSKVSTLTLDENLEFKRMTVRGPRRVKSDDGFPGYDFQLEVKYLDRR